jgi:hypothetical protein
MRLQTKAWPGIARQITQRIKLMGHIAAPAQRSDQACFVVVAASGISTRGTTSRAPEKSVRSMVGSDLWGGVTKNQPAPRIAYNCKFPVAGSKIRMLSNAPV